MESTGKGSSGVDGKFSVPKAILRLVSARGVGLVLRLFASLGVARIAGPEAVGVASWIGVFSLYALWLTGGVLHGAERMVPIHRVQDRMAEADRIWQVVATIVTLAVGLCITIGSVFFVFRMSDPHETQVWKYYAAGLLSGITLLGNFAATLFTAEKRFYWLNRMFLLEGVFWWVLLPLAWGGASGLALRTILVAALPPMICLHGARSAVRLGWDGRLAWNTLYEGAPILLSHFLSLLMLSLDRTFVAFLMTPRDLGHYLLATTIVNGARLLHYSVQRIVSPHLSETFGRTGDPSAVARAALNAVLPVLGVVVPAAIAGQRLLEPLTQRFLPEYLPGVGAARIALAGSAMVPGMAMSLFFVAVGQQRRLVLLLTVGLLVQFTFTVCRFCVCPRLETMAYGFVVGIATNLILIASAVVCHAFGTRVRNPNSGEQGKGFNR